MKTIHIAEMTSQGGRDGTVEAADGNFSVALSSKESPASVTPEHLFGGAFAACFFGALENAAETSHLKIPGLAVTSRTSLIEDTDGRWKLNVELRATLPGVGESEAKHLLHLAHQSCPYSRATRGNINVSITLD